MSNKPYITYSDNPLSTQKVGAVVTKAYVNEAGQVSFGVIDYVPGWYIPLHRHNTWELIIIDASSPNAGFVLFNGRWWRAEPGSSVFVPKGYPHAWASGNETGFKMLWVYSGSHEEAGRTYEGNPEAFKPISKSEEKAARMWSATAMG
jgi:quercetin dioxygenase-like cupin family protein